jgi:ADP-dependent NAD(P)H-hydrate dehydratase / NAD(P)H-hydrate epimerase
VARYLLNRGVCCHVCLLSERETVKGDAAVNLEILTRMGGNIIEVLNLKALQTLKGEIAHNDLLVDGILGTGLNAPVQGFFYEIISFINSLHLPVVAIDIPSGLDAGTGQVLGICLRVCLTVTFGLPKRGLLLYPGAQYCGELVTVDISLPRAAIEMEPIQDYLIEGEDFIPILAPRHPTAHKGDYGHLLVLSGSVGKTGAAAMVCQAAMRVGAGLVTLGIPESLNPIMEEKLTEVMTEPLPETSEKSLSLSAKKRITELFPRKNALALGPGLSLHPETVELVRAVVGEFDLPVVIDADGLGALAGEMDTLRTHRRNMIFTPHPGEMARLLGVSIPDIQHNRAEVARRFSKESGLILVLKGARTLVASPEGDLFINPTGNPGMASGGMGDVLTGMIGGFLAQGFPPLEAAKLGVYLHGLTGDFVAHRKGERGMVASDLIAESPKILQALTYGKTQINDFFFSIRNEIYY